LGCHALKLPLLLKVVLVGWAAIYAAAIVYWANYALLIILINLLVLRICSAVLFVSRTKKLRSEDQGTTVWRALSRGFKKNDGNSMICEALYHGMMNGMILGFIVGIVANVIVGRYIPISYSVSSGVFLGIVSAVQYPHILAKTPSL
jgi:hypothetical protein